MKRLPRKIKKIAKNCLAYSTTESYNHQGILGNLPAYGIVFISIVYHRTHFKHIVLFGKKIRMAEFKGMLDI